MIDNTFYTYCYTSYFLGTYTYASNTTVVSKPKSKLPIRNIIAIAEISHF